MRHNDRNNHNRNIKLKVKPQAISADETGKKKPR